MQNTTQRVPHALGVNTMRPVAISLLLMGLAATNPAIAGFVNQAVPLSTREETAAKVPTEQSKGKPLPDSSQPDAIAAVTGQVADKEIATPLRPRVQEIGRRPAHIYEPRGRGTQIALSDVMLAITPQFVVDYADVSRTVPVSWAGGKGWPDVLSDVVTQMPGATATIDWSNSTVTFGLPKLASGAPQFAAERIAARWDVRAADLTLRQTLMRWAKDAGWQVSWEVKYDFPVQLEAVFAGTFENAIEQFTASLRSSEFPLLGCLYEGNRVVRILHYGDSKGCDK